MKCSEARFRGWSGKTQDSLKVSNSVSDRISLRTAARVSGWANLKAMALAQEWEDGPLTYLGLAIAGYPNLFTITGPQSPSVLSNMPVSIEQHVEWITECIAHMRRNKLATIEASPQAQDAWGAHVAEVVNSTLMPGTNSWYMGANIAGKPRRFLPYLGPEGVGGYRRKCAEIAENGYEGFVFTSAGRGGTVQTIAAE